MKKIYYLFSFAFIFLFLQQGLAQAGCSDLEITAVEDGSVCGGGSVTLQATGSGTGDEIVWYNAATGGNIIGMGNTYRSPNISSTTSYWASEVLFDGSGAGMSPELLYYKFDEGSSIVNYAITPVGSNPVSITGTGLTVGGSGLVGTALEGAGTSSTSDVINTGWNTSFSGSFTIGFWISDVPSSGTLYYIFGDAGADSFRCFTNGVAGAGNWQIRGGGLPDLTANGAATAAANYVHFVYDAGAGTYTSYVDGVVDEVVTVSGSPSFPTGSGFQVGGYSTNSGLAGKMDELRIYDRALSQSEILNTVTDELASIDCESPREEVIATVNNNADEDIASLPYTHTENTATYFNNYAGAPGSDCGTTDGYLNGNDVVYKYTADDDYILSVELTDLDEINTAIFVYEDCADIGDSCAVEGSINDKNTANHGFQMLVEDGKDYFFVVSSAEPTDSFNYTLKIDGNTCANYPAPTGGTSQDFVDGQKLFDLGVTGINLTWYSDSALTNEIDEDTDLVDATTYYVTQTFDTCESSALAITANEVSCSVLDVVATEDGEVCGEGTVWLSANGAEALANTNIYWFDSATGGNVVGKGNEFQTDVLEQTTSFWAAEVALSAGGEETGLGKSIADAGNAGYAPSSSGYGLQFTANEAFTLASVTVLSSGSGGDVNIVLKENDHAGQIIDTKTLTVVGGGSTSNPIPDELILEFEIPGPGTYYIYADDGPNMIRDSSGSSFPYSLGAYGEITTGYSVSSSASAYYFFYDWAIGSEEIICESDRVEVIAEVNEVADEIVSGSLPYTHTATTKDYGNNYFGEPGTDCIAESYLDGNDVVYQFSPSIGAVYSIELSGLSSNNAGVFVYESCYDIGVSCIAGAVGDGTTADFGIDEVALNDGQDYFIIISTKTSSSTDYTITIDEAQIDCADYQDAPIGDEEQIVNIGSTLDDLKVKGANLIWYSDSSLNTVLPGTTVIDDGETYYVTQTLNGCDSDYLEVTVYEIDCSKLEVVNVEDATIVCWGSVMLEAEGTGVKGADLYWYDSETSEDVIGIGEAFITPELSQTRSYWVAEVFTEQGSGGFNSPLPSYCTPTFSTGCTSNDYIDDFILEESTGRKLIEHLGTGCSNNAYADYTGDSSLSASLVAGSTYNFTVTHGTSSQYIRIWIDFDGNGSFEDDGELVYESNTAGSTTVPTIDSFELPNNLISRSTVMRVKTTWSTGASDSCTQSGAYGEAHDYRINIIGSEVVCESPRKEIIVEVTPDPDEEITSLPYSHSENTGTYGHFYGGTPGDNCGITENYLNGSSAVYTYTATDDDLITIELTDLDQYYAGVFVYESCNEIGEECLAGAVAGPSTNDVMIQDFPVEEGETYYIVVSSWLTNNIDYTLKVNSFSCSDLETPDGDSTQQFVAGDTVDDLTVEATRVGAILTWYEDAGLTQEITDPSTHDLVDGDSYYVTQTLNGCESDPLIITADEIDCSDLEIVDYTEATVACRGAVTLKAEASGTGSEIYWYDELTGGDVVGKGTSFTTPELTQTTSYWASEVFIDDYVRHTQQAEANPPALLSSVTSNGGVQFEVFESFTLESVTVLGTGTGGDIQVDIRDIDDNNDVIFSTTATVAGGGTTTSPESVVIPIDFDLEPGNYRILRVNTGTSVNLGYMSAANSSFPYVLGNNLGEVTSGSLISSTSTLYYFFYDWTIMTGEVTCESPRQEVVATIDQSGDIQLDYADLPYTDANNTSHYGNTFSGTAGDGCDSGNYLNGYEAMYYYEADPNEDDILTIELSNTNNPGAAVFVYESCGDVGIACLGGATLENGVATIEDVYVEAGKQLLIVVSSLSGTVDYELDIYGVDCNNLAGPTGDSTPYFVIGDVVDDLVVDASIYNQELKWYKDAALTDEIIDPTAETLVDGTSYFVTQTILGCESLGFEITPFEFDCSLMGVDPQVEEVYVCAPGGLVTLEVDPTGIGSEVFWYDAETDGNYLGKGTEMTFSVDQNISFWATEAFISGSVVEKNQAETNPPALLSSTLTNYGLLFSVDETFTLEDVTVLSTAAGGEIQVDIRDIDNNNDIVFTTKANIPGGGATANPIPVVIPIDFELQPGNYRILRVTSGTTVGLGYMSALNSSFPYTIGDNLGTITSGSTLTGTTTAYYLFYDWTIRTGDVICESTRTEYQVQLNDVVPNPPVVTPLQKICGDGLLSDVLVLGENVQWYDTNGSALNLNSPIVEGQRYYVTQTIKGCESEMQEVIMDFNDKSEEPVAAVNQAFETGETLQDLTVHGDNLRWYKDQFKTEELSENTKLVDQTTYYVTQELEDFCESGTLGITVHEVLDVKDQLFEYFEFYPNPVVDVLYITNSETIEQIEIFDLAGRKVVTHKSNTSDLKLNVEELSTGTYLLKAKVDGMEKVFRIIKK